MTDPSQHFDKRYWGEKGIDLSRWGYECARGIAYKNTGSPVDSGTPGQVRKISTGRKAHRGMASDSLMKDAG